MSERATGSTAGRQVAGYPRLYCTAADLPLLRARTHDTQPLMGGSSGAAIWASILATAENYLTEASVSISYATGGNIVKTFPLPPVQPEPLPDPPGFTAGRYPYWTLLSREVQARLELLSLVAVITEDERFSARAKQYALSLAAWDTWSDPTYPCHGLTCLDTAHFTLGISACFDFLQDQFSANERRQILQALTTKGVIPLYTDSANPVDHNISMLRASALASGSLILLGNDPNAEQYLQRATDAGRWFLDRRLNSGQQEGLLYTSYSLDNLLRAADHILRATGQDQLLNHPFVRDFLVRWVVLSLAPGGRTLANFSDSGLETYFGPTMRILARTGNNGLATWYLQYLGQSEPSFASFLYSIPVSNDSAPALSATSTVLEEIGWGLLRTGWQPDDLLLAFVSNNSTMGHNHYDQNSFQIATQGTWLASDPGYQEYSQGPRHDFTVRLGHSTVLVDQQGQANFGGGQLNRGFVSNTCDYLRGSAAAAYGDALLTQFDRQIVFVRPDYFVMLDQLAAPEPHQYSWRLFSGLGCRYQIDAADIQLGSTIHGRQVLVAKEQAGLLVTSLATVPLAITVATHPGAEEYGSFCQLDTPEPVQEWQFLTVLQAGAAEALATSALQCQRLENDMALGVSIAQAGNASVTDLLLFARGSAAIVLADVHTDAELALVSHNAQGELLRYMLSQGTSLIYQEQPLVRAATPCIVAGTLDPEQKRAEIVIETAVTQDVAFLVPSPVAQLLINGLVVSGSQDQPLVSVRLAPGRHLVQVS